MTKFILHGGKSRLDCENNRNFYREMFSSYDKKEINFLVVSFAKKNDPLENLPIEERSKIENLNPEKDIKFEIASKDKFLNQVSTADIIYLRGGDGYAIREILGQYGDFLKFFEGKTVAGSSAGTNVLAKYYYDNDYKRVESGLGFLPIKTICHFSDRNVEHLVELDQYGEKLELFPLAETKYIIKEIF